MKPTLIVLIGPTGVGKTKMAVALGRHFSTVVLYADSRQLYQEMSIGTAKPSDLEMGGVRHYFVNDRTLDTPVNAGSFEKEALERLSLVFQSNNVALLSGGSGLYIQAVCSGLDDLPEIKTQTRIELNEIVAANGLEPLLEELALADPTYFSSVDRNNPQRIIRALEVIRESGKPFSSFRKKTKKVRPFNILKIGLHMDRAALYEQLNKRVDTMITSGLFDEVASLQAFEHHDALQTVGYQEIFGYLNDEYDYDETVRLIKRNTRRYAKRQLTWFGRDDEVKWFKPDQTNKIVEWIEKRLDT